MIRQTTIITIFAGLIALTGPDSARAQNGPPPATVRVAEIDARLMSRTITSPASVISRNDAHISAETTGRITQIAEPGDVLESGEVIAQIDDRQARIQLEEARARLSRASANAAYQNAEAERFTQLAANGTVPPTRLREAELARDMAASDLREARSAVARAELELDRTQIRAPFTGRVVERLIEVGELSSPGREVLRFVDVSRKEAVAQAPVSIAPYLSVGQEVTLTGSDDQAISAPIRAIVPVGDRVSRTFEVRIDLAGSDWIVGSAARAVFPAENPRTQLTVPYDAVILRANGSHVFIVDADDIARQVSVEPGVREGGFIAIEGDVEAGQTVVISGAETLSDGRPVQIQGEDA
ncbi:efflux RND transporter periplasmic adaptor subunit [Maricaulis sp.]|uniref:efflux RND transporter periplasmic adaptor subunit n=1 Tax=Maricaulis sp. TaxID=1486257 RepID=UPI002616DCCF|nr:efflux RND transporter periplasmic adaptor subunit [Maricaulis sp.]